MDFKSVYKQYQKVDLEDIKLWMGVCGKTAEIIDFHRDGMVHESRSNGLAYSISGLSGVLCLPGVLSDTLQLELAANSLSRYCEGISYSNIDSNSHDLWCEYTKTHRECTPVRDILWNEWKQENKSDILELGADECLPDGLYQVQPGHNGHSGGGECEGRGYSRSMARLRWVTLGYHYNWTDRSYDDRYQCEVPEELKQLTASMHQVVVGIKGGRDFNSEAVIVNYYGPKDIMGGHRDDIEFDHSQPLYSYSIGCHALFVIGGTESKEEPAIVVLLRPGDCVVLEGEGRLRYHGVARIIPDELWGRILRLVPSLSTRILPNSNISSMHQLVKSATARYVYIDGGYLYYCDGKGDIKCVGNGLDVAAIRFYLATHRININVRQVLPESVKSVADYRTKMSTN